MKKLISILSLALGLFVSVTAFVACGSNDEENGSSSNPLVGTWYTTEPNDDGHYYTITFKADYTCTWFEYDDPNDQTSFDADTGKYTVEGNKLAIWWDSEKEWWDEGPWTTTFSITGNKMITTENGGTTWTKK